MMKQYYCEKCDRESNSIICEKCNSKTKYSLANFLKHSDDIHVDSDIKHFLKTKILEEELCLENIKHSNINEEHHLGRLAGYKIVLQFIEKEEIKKEISK